MLIKKLLTVLLCLLSGFALVLPSTAAAETKYAAIVVHADTGEILFNKYATSRRYPASLTKMMTLYILFEELEAGRLSLNSKLKVSRRAAGQPASKLGLKSGSTITVEKAIEALVIKSANDVATVVAERIGGTEVKFARKMTLKAKELGMTNTQFRNASGLPNSRQRSTARDIATLSRRIVQDHPKYYKYFQRKSFVWKGRTYKSHNRLVTTFAGADGLKTGYTRASGYNLATTAVRNNNRLIGVVLGGRSSRSRDAHMAKILNDSYNRIRRNPALISSLNRNVPTPNLKPTTLAALGGVWPLGTPSPSLKPSLRAPTPQQPAPQTLAAAKTTAPTIANNQSLQGELALIANSGQWVNSDGHGSPLKHASSVKVASLDTTAGDEASVRGTVIKEGEGQGDFEVARDWSIQIGAYRQLNYAEIRIQDAALLLTEVAPHAEKAIDEIGKSGRNLYRLRFNNLTDSEAEAACKAIIAKGGDCFGVKATPQNG